jgi:hypothetical protein
MESGITGDEAGGDAAERRHLVALGQGLRQGRLPATQGRVPPHLPPFDNPASPCKGDIMFQGEFIKLLRHTASTTMKDISGCEVRPPLQGGKTNVRDFTGPWVAGSDETGALDPRLLSIAAPRRMATTPWCEIDFGIPTRPRIQLRNPSYPGFRFQLCGGINILRGNNVQRNPGFY